MVRAGNTMIMNRYSFVRFRYVGKDKNAIHITIPWLPDMFNQFKNREAFLIVGCT